MEPRIPFSVDPELVTFRIFGQVQDHLQDIHPVGEKMIRQQRGATFELQYYRRGTDDRASLAVEEIRSADGLHQSNVYERLPDGHQRFGADADGVIFQGLRLRDHGAGEWSLRSEYLGHAGAERLIGSTQNAEPPAHWRTEPDGQGRPVEILEAAEPPDEDTIGAAAGRIVPLTVARMLAASGFEDID